MYALAVTYVMFIFSYNEKNFYASPGPSGVEFKGPFWHPLRLLPNLTWHMFALVPVFYFVIFKSRKRQELTAGKNILQKFRSYIGRHQCIIFSNIGIFPRQLYSVCLSSVITAMT